MKPSLEIRAGQLLPVLLLGLSALAASCGPGKGKARLVGKIDNISQADVYVYGEDGAAGRVDTIHMEDGRFTYERPLARPVLLTLLYPNFTQTDIVLEPGKTVRLRGDAARIGTAEITGTDENRLLTDFREANISAPPANQRMAAAQFVRDHAATLAAVAVFKKYFAVPKTTDTRTARELLETLHKAQPGNAALTQLHARLLPRLLHGAGERLPAFSAETLDGQTVGSGTFRGRRLLIVFCAGWSGESLYFLRSVCRARSEGKYGDCRLLALSLDPSREQLRDRLRRDTLGVPVVCDGKAFASPLVQKLGVRYIPSLMAVSAAGVIEARDITNLSDIPVR